MRLLKLSCAAAAAKAVGAGEEPDCADLAGGMLKPWPPTLERGVPRAEEKGDGVAEADVRDDNHVQFAVVGAGCAG